MSGEIEEIKMRKLNKETQVPFNTA